MNRDQYLPSPDVVNWLLDQEWSEVIPVTTITYPKGYPDGLKQSVQLDCCTTTVAIGANEYCHLTLPVEALEVLKSDQHARFDAMVLPTPECPDTLSDETIIDWLENEIRNWFQSPTTIFDDPFYQLLDLTQELKILLALAAKYGRYYNQNEIWQLIGYHPIDNPGRIKALEYYTDFMKSLVTSTQTQGED
jgi:hypothetical protein